MNPDSSDHFAEALYQLNLAREALRREPLKHREAALYAVTEAEKAISHAIGLTAERVDDST